MSGSASREAVPMLLVAGAIAAVVAFNAVADRLAILADLGLALLAVGSVVTVVLLAVRRWRTGRALRRRVRVQLVPTDGFDPSTEAVLRFASALARTRRTVGGLLAGRAAAARIRISPDPLGRLAYELDVPAHARNSVAAASYAEVDLHDTEPEPAPSATGRATARLELVLARHGALPLRAAGLEPDPLSALARTMERLAPGEHVQVCVDLLPVTAAARRRTHRRLLREARERPTVRPLDLLAEASSRRPGRGTPVAEVVERRVGQRALVAKLGAPEPLFHLQVLIAATAADRERAVGHVQSAMATFDAFAGENHFRACGLRLPGGLGIWGGADSWWRRGRFDRRLATRLFAPGRRRLVTASEIAGLLKPPSVHCASGNVVRSGGVIPPPPPGLPTFHGQPDLLPLGRLANADGRAVGVPLQDTFFSYLGGRSRYGKTETAIGQCLHLARAGHGVLFLDPHQDAIAKLKTYLTDPSLAGRVVEVNLADPDRQPGWNLLATHGHRPNQRPNRVDAVVDAFASTLGWGEQNTRALNLVTQATQALTDLSTTLPPQLAPTLFQIPTLLGNDAWRDAVLPHIGPATRRFFLERFPRLSTEAITPVTNLIDRLRVAPQVAALLGQPVSSYDIRAAMDRGLIVLASPGTGSVRDRLIANFLVYDLLHQAKTRTDTPPEKRRPFFVFLDEVQTYDGAGSENLAGLLEQAAKYGIRAFLFNQNPERLSPATWNAISTNRSHLATTALASKAAALLAREWAGQVDPSVITRMERYRYLASITLHQQITPPFLLAGIPVQELFPDEQHPDRVEQLDATIDRTTRRQPVADTLRALDDHDQRILTALNHPRRPAGQGTRRRGRDVPGPGGVA